MTSPEQMTHESALQLLPWLVNNSLASADASAARKHALNCVICRRELQSLELFQDRFALAAESVIVPATDMRAINQRIDKLIERQYAWRNGLLYLKDLARRPWHVAFVAQSIALLVLTGIMLRPDPPQAEFTTLSNPTTAVEGDVFRVVFSLNLEERALSGLLSEFELSVVAGPTERGVYTLSRRRPLGAQSRGELAATLEKRPEVLFAQAVSDPQ